VTDPVFDPTTAAIEASSDERDRLRVEVARLSKIGDTLFAEGYDQAVREIRDHFRSAKQVDVADEIEKIWLKHKPS
jgi:hypothetical protein